MRRSAFYEATLAVCTATRPNAALCAVARLDNGRIHSAVSAVAYSDTALDVAAWLSLTPRATRSNPVFCARGMAPDSGFGWLDLHLLA